MPSRSLLRALCAVVLLSLNPCFALFAQDGTLAGQLQTQAIAADLQGTTPPAHSPAAAPTNPPPASLRGSAEVERAYGYRGSSEGPVPQALHHMSEYRFFYSAGFVLFNLLALLSVDRTAARRIFGTFCVIGVLFLLHYLFIGIAIPPLRPDDWKGPIQRSMGIRSIQEWNRVPDIGTSLFVIREKNFLGPKNETPMSSYFSQVISERTAGKEAKVEYAEEFITHGIRWRPAVVTPSKGGKLYFWAAEFKQQRVVIELVMASSPDADRDLQEIVTLVGNIK